ncbi:vertnin [Gouania willdenowi]|nr:vertnin [Gouania willdenowi]
MNQRQELVLSALREFQEATDSPGLEAVTCVAQEVYQLLAPFQLPKCPCKNYPEWTGVDAAARSLFPADAPAGLLPLSCNGEGNLLFDAVSMLLTGNTELSLELQVRTVVEMVLWKRYYLSEMIDSKMMLQAVRFSLSVEESADMLNLPVTVLEAMFDADVKASCFPGSYANMWHIYALSSVLRFNIYSIYPLFNFKIRPYFNRIIRPRILPEGLVPPTVHVMWSGPLQPGSFRPNHFVALARMDDPPLKSPLSEQRVSPSNSDEQPNHNSKPSFHSLKDKYNITKSTFYRWKRQTQDHSRKSAIRYDAKYFLQACFLEGKVVSLHEFKAIFPEISRSSYYNWKHELMKSGGTFSTSAEDTSPGESTEQEAWSSPEAKQDDSDHHDSVASMFGLSLGKIDIERANNLAHMAEAKRRLQNCIATNTSFPFRVFKRSFPGISRSTYYNWRKEAMLFNRGYKCSAGSSEDSSDADKSHSPKSLSPIPSRISHPRPRICRQKHKSFRMAYISKKQLREAAKSHLLKSKCSLTKFKLRFPSMSPCFYWLWRNGWKHKPKMVSHIAEINVHKSPENTETEKMMEERSVENQSMPTFFKSPQNMQNPIMPALNHPPPGSMVHIKAPVHEQMFAMDMVSLANFKANAKLFLQQRFEEKSFPTFKEFRSYFPFTPRSTYYMWKRALHHGVSLIHG